MNNYLCLLAIIIGGVLPGLAQTSALRLTSPEEAIAIALDNNAGLQALAQEELRQQQLIKTAVDLGTTHIYHSFDENNLSPENQALRVFGVQQTIPFPTTWSGRRQLYRTQAQLARAEYQREEWRLKQQVAQTYYENLYRQNRLRRLRYLDSLYADFTRAADRRYTLGESEYLEKITAENYALRLKMQRMQEESALLATEEKLRGLLLADEAVSVAYAPLTLAHSTDSLVNHPVRDYYRFSQQQAEAGLRLQRRSLWPSISLEYFRGFEPGEMNRYYDGYSVGLSFPLWFMPSYHRIQADKYQLARRQQEGRQYEHAWGARQKQLQAALDQLRQSLRYREEQGLPAAREMQEIARKTFLAGEINFLNYVQILENATQSQLDYLDNLNQYNQTYWDLYYLTSIE